MAVVTWQFNLRGLCQTLDGRRKERIRLGSEHVNGVDRAAWCRACARVSDEQITSPERLRNTPVTITPSTAAS